MEECRPPITYVTAAFRDECSRRESLYGRHLEAVLNTPALPGDDKMAGFNRRWCEARWPPEVADEAEKLRCLQAQCASGARNADWYTPKRIARMFPHLAGWYRDGAQIATWARDIELALQNWVGRVALPQLQGEVYRIYGFGPEDLGGRDLYTGDDPVLQPQLAHTNLCEFQSEMRRRYPVLNPRNPKERLTYYLLPTHDRDGRVVDRVAKLGHSVDDVRLWREVMDTSPFAPVSKDDRVVELQFRYRHPESGAWTPLAHLLRDSHQCPVWGRAQLRRAWARCPLHASCPVATAVEKAEVGAVWFAGAIEKLAERCYLWHDRCPVLSLLATAPEYDPVVLFAAQFFDEEIDWRRRWMLRRCPAPREWAAAQEYWARVADDTPSSVKEYLAQEGRGDERSPACGRWFVTKDKDYDAVTCGPECADALSYLKGARLKLRVKRLDRSLQNPPQPPKGVPS